MACDHDDFGTSCGMCCFSLHSCIFWVRSSAHRWKQVSLTTLFSDASRLCQSSLFQFICNRRLLPYTSTSQVSCICLFGAMFPCGCRKWKYHCITVLLSFYCMQVFWRTCRHNDFSMHLPLALYYIYTLRCSKWLSIPEHFMSLIWFLPGIDYVCVLQFSAETAIFIMHDLDCMWIDH